MSQYRPSYGTQLPQISPQQLVKLVIGGLAVILVLWGVFSSFYTVDTDSEAVVLRFGRYRGTMDPGLHFKLPFGIDEAIPVSVLKSETEEFGLKTEVAGIRTRYARTTAKHRDISEMLTGDLNIADVRWTLQYRIRNAKDYLFNVDDVEKTIRDVSEAVMRRLVGDRSVDEVITIGRTEVKLLAQKETQEKLDELGCGIELVNLNLQDVGPPEQVKEAFNNVNRARQKKEEMINQARAQRNLLVPAARGKARLQIAEAEAYRKRKILEVTGETGALLARYAEYEKAKRETRIRLYMETMEKALIQSQRKVFIDESVKGILPHLDLAPRKGGVQ